MVLERLLQAAGRVPTALLLIPLNLIPLAGVAWWGWDLQTILVLYWIESGVVGLLNVPRIALAGGEDGAAGGTGPVGIRPPRVQGLGVTAAKVVYIPFFIAHYGIFWVVHGVFVFALPSFAGMARPVPSGPALGPFGAGVDWSDVAIGAVGLALFHVVSFAYWDLIHGESRRMSPGAQLFAPYQRVFVLHLTILGGAFLIAMTGQPIAALVILVTLKIVLDLAAHVREHLQRQGAR